MEAGQGQGQHGPLEIPEARDPVLAAALWSISPLLDWEIAVLSSQGC